MIFTFELISNKFAIFKKIKIAKILIIKKIFRCVTSLSILLKGIDNDATHRNIFIIVKILAIFIFLLWIVLINSNLCKYSFL